MDRHRREERTFITARSPIATVRLLLLVVGSALLVAAVVLGVTPGSDPMCGSILVPRFAWHHSCSGAALTLLPPLVVVAALGAAMVVSAVVIAAPTADQPKS